MLIRFLLAIGFLLVANPASSLILSGGAPYSWSHVAVGAGGQVTGLSIANDGKKVVKTDVGGGYIWNGSTWAQLVTKQSIPANLVYATDFTLGGGVWEIAIAPGNSSYIYMLWQGYLFKSTNTGAYFSITNMPRLTGYAQNQGGATDPNGNNKFCNQKIIIDPANENVVYVTTNNSATQRTLNGGTLFETVSSITQGSNGGGCGLAFDSSAGTTTLNGITVTKNVIIPSYAQGVWRSSNGGSTFSQIADGSSGNSPTSIWTGKTGVDGVYWATDHTNVWKYTSGSWTKYTISPAAGVQSIAPDPNNAGHVLFGSVDHGGGWINVTLDNGADSFALNWSGIFGAANHLVGQSASDIPWLATSDTGFMTNGDMQTDPSDGKVYFAEGIGVYRMTFPVTQVDQTWAAQSLGIEEMVANDIIAPLGANKQFAGWDRGLFSFSGSLLSFLSAYSPFNAAFVAAWSLDYASNDPTFEICVCNWFSTHLDAISSNAGASWTPWNTGVFTTISAVADTGSIARLTVASTAGFSTWSAGSGSLVYIIGSSYATNGYQTVSVVDSTHIDLPNVLHNQFLTGSGLSGWIYVSSFPTWDYNGAGTITGAASAGGLIRLTVSDSSIFAVGVPIYVSGVGGTTEANGNWVPSSIPDGTHVDLQGSTFTHAYTSGGTAKTLAPHGGSIAASSSTNFVMLPGNNGVPYNTKNGGQTWTQLTALPTDGWQFAYYLRNTSVAADRVTGGKFYLYNYVHGLYVSVDAGDTWTLQPGTVFSHGGSNQRLRATPGVAGDIWYTQGPQDPSIAGNGFAHSTNSGANFSDISGVNEVWDFGFGKAASGRTYPSMFIIGYVGGIFGIWRSDDANAATPSWTQINTDSWPTNWVDYIRTINGDMNTWGRVYIGWSGTGYAYGDPVN